MMKSCKHIGFLALLLFCVLVSKASAVTIVARFIGGAPPENAVGGGSLPEIVDAAARIWESAYADPVTITIHYGWADIGDAGTHTLQESDSDGREIAGMILFDNTGSTPFYLDPTPRTSEEYRRKVEESQDFGTGLLPSAWVYSHPLGDAAGHVDLLSVALHELGHALGLSAANPRFVSQSLEGNLRVSEEYRFGGSIIPLAHNNFGVVPHLDSAKVAYGSVMSGINADERRMPSELDVLANAQISGFTMLKFSPEIFPATEHVRGSIPGSGSRGRVALRVLADGSQNAVSMPAR